MPLLHSLRLTLTIASVLMLSGFPGFAKDGRDFAGFFSLAEATEQGEQVHVTLSLQIFNYSGGDLKDVEVTVQAAHPELGVLGSFDPIPLWRNGHDVILSQQFTISREEFKIWSTHGQPNLFILHPDDNGETRRGTAQLTRRESVTD